MGIKFPTPWKTLIIKFTPPRDGKGVKFPGYARGGHVEASISPIHYCNQNPTLIFQIFLIDFIPGIFYEAKILKIHINFWDRKSAIKYRVLAELSFPHASYLYKRFAWQRFASLRLFTCLVYFSTYCVPIAHLRQNKPFPLLYLGHAQTTKHLMSGPPRVLMFPLTN